MLTFDEDLHLYRVDGRIVPSVTQVLCDCGVVAYGPRTAEMEFYLQRGLFVHECLALWVRGELDEDSIDPNILGYVDAGRECITREGWKTMAVEQMVSGAIPRIGVYAGRYDLNVIGGPMVDWKTGEVQRWTRLQLAALSYALGEPAKERIGVRLNNDGTYELTMYPYHRADMQRFAACLTVYYEKHPSKRRNRRMNGTNDAEIAEAI